MKSKSFDAAKQPHSPVQTMQHKHSKQILGSSAAHLPSENFPHLACWSGLACKKFEFYFQQWRLGTCRALCCDNCCVSCVHYGANKKSRSKDLSGLASTSAHQLLASSCLGRPAQMSGAPSTSSLEVLKDQCVQGAVLRENFNHRHTNIDHKAQVRHMHSHSGTVGAHQHLNAPEKECQYACQIISHSQTDPLKKTAITLSLSSLSSSPPILAISALLGILYLDPSSSHLRRSHRAVRISSLSMLLIIWRHDMTGQFEIQPTQSWGRTWSFDPWRRCWACQDSCAKSCSRPWHWHAFEWSIMESWLGLGWLGEILCKLCNAIMDFRIIMMILTGRCQGSLGYLVTNLVKNFVTNFVMNLVNHRIWWWIRWEILWRI